MLEQLIKKLTMREIDAGALRAALRQPKGMLMAGGRMLGYYSTTVVASPALAAETVICTTQPFNPPVDLDVIFVIGWASFTVGTSGVSAQMQLREGSTTSGTSVAASGATTVVATDVYSQTIIGVDTVNTVNAFQYSLTLKIGSGAAASTVSQVGLLALCT